MAAPQVLVVGGGAAGLLAAIFAARAGARTLVVDGRRALGAKIRVSGGGRCNVLPAAVTPADYATSGSPHALRNILMSWPLAEVIRFFTAELGVPLRVEPPQKLFPASGRARDVVAALLAEAARQGVQLQLGVAARALRPLPGGGSGVQLADGSVLTAPRVVLACGGLSLPRTGSDGSGWALLRAHGHVLVPPHPALVALHVADPGLCALSGLAAPAALTLPTGAAHGELLITHHGISGPAALDISRLLTAPAAQPMAARPLRVAWTQDAAAWGLALRAGRGTVAAVLRARLPRRLADLLCARAGVAPDAPLATLGRAARAALAAQAGAMPLSAVGSDGYARAEVTAGGIPLSDVHTRTLESRLLPGVHVAGEMLDAVGRLGGFNFLWAWASGRRAGRAAAAAALGYAAPAAPLRARISERAA